MGRCGLRKSDIDKDWLYNQYVTLGKSPKQISVEFGLNYSTVIHRIYDIGIKKDHEEKIYNSREWLYQQYIINGKTAKQIANEIGCGKDTIAHKLSEFGIKRKRKTYPCDNYDWLYNQYIVQDKTYKQISEEFDIPIGTLVFRGEKFGIKKEKPIYTKEFLYEEHIVKHKNMLQIARETGRNNTTVKKYMDKYNIPIWTYGDAQNEYRDNEDGTTSVLVYDGYGEYIDSFTIDTNEVDRVKTIKWLLVKDNIVKNRERYRVESNTHPAIILGRFLLNITDSEMLVDHKDNNPLNNTLSNLRIATRSNNQSNHDIHTNNTSGFTGVSYDKKKDIWYAQIKSNGIKYNLGKYKKIEDAVYARFCAEQILFGDFRSNRNDDNILKEVDKCINKEEIKQRIINTINRRKHSNDN